MAQHGSGGESRPDGAAVVRRIDTEEFEEHVKSLQDALVLAPGTRVWATVRWGEDEVPRLEVRAATTKGDVTVGREFPLPTELRAALKKAVDHYGDGLKGELKAAVARTLAAQAMGVGQEED